MEEEEEEMELIKNMELMKIWKTGQDSGEDPFVINAPNCDI